MLSDERRRNVRSVQSNEGHSASHSSDDVGSHSRNSRGLIDEDAHQCEYVVPSDMRLENTSGRRVAFAYQVNNKGFPELHPSIVIAPSSSLWSIRETEKTRCIRRERPDGMGSSTGIQLWAAACTTFLKSTQYLEGKALGDQLRAHGRAKYRTAQNPATPFLLGWRIAERKRFGGGDQEGWLSLMVTKFLESDFRLGTTTLTNDHEDLFTTTIPVIQAIHSRNGTLHPPVSPFVGYGSWSNFVGVSAGHLTRKLFATKKLRGAEKGSRTGLSPPPAQQNNHLHGWVTPSIRNPTSWCGGRTVYEHGSSEE
ncbi:uncharacterized protein LACBIDRAFT_335262 [Laccaria bicolor S238N-H82]|uniref:Predicted protein n=1 Tax=Laccaria bicolor (strain S238N-H82 / ATCC MYA-4686) TaxID=486041 RepID=B0E1U7_LACBS|nr:uncharacterized protein LACBIDRAFT_335262 [Laccaria bicolor S238N-H82]EDQ99186.1 predicted protein [Laccaria bicolor S238N-H82]|eukprot:XP_001890153.1 predicted protein [Laccaria bicolor S238N-H82]